MKLLVWWKKRRLRNQLRRVEAQARELGGIAGETSVDYPERMYALVSQIAVLRHRIRQLDVTQDLDPLDKL